MERRRFLRSLGLGAVAAVLPRPALAEDAAERRPNIIYLMTDDQRWDTLGCYGNPEFKTHNLDRLATQGVLFENCFYAVSICMPSRATVLTGQYLSRHRCGFDEPTQMTISRAEFGLTYPSLLRRAGYRAGFIGKLGFAVTEKKVPNRNLWKDAKNLPANGFDYWRGWAGQAPRGQYWPKDYGQEASHADDAQPHLTDVIGALILDFIDTNPAGTPFCLSVSFHAPKGALNPQDVKPEYDKPFENVTFALPDNYVAGANESLPEVIRRNWRGYTRYHPKYTWTPQLYQKFVRRQAGLAYGVDVVVGRLVKKLEERRLLNNTVIIFTSDNGFMNGSHGLDGKTLLYEESMRAPLIVFDGRLPNHKRGRRLTELTSTVDLAPTIVDLAGLSIPKGMQGTSIRRLAQGYDIQWRDAVFMESNFTNYRFPGLKQVDPSDAETIARIKRDSLRCRGIRTERWKYIRFHELEPVFEQLFDLENDPLEQHDLVRDRRHGEVLNALRERCAGLYAEACGLS